MIILGIDPSLNSTGWGVIDFSRNQYRYIASGSIRSSAKDDISTKLRRQFDELNRIVELYKPERIGTEESFVNINPSTSLKLGYVRGIVILIASLNSIKLYTYSATEIKKSVSGFGRAEKGQVHQMIVRIMPESAIKYEDESDALAVAIRCSIEKL